MEQKLILTTLPVNQLETLIIDCVNACLRTYHLQENNDPFSHFPEHLTRRQAAEVLNVCLSKLDQLSKDGQLTKYRNGSLVRFKKSEVLNFLQSFNKYQRA